MSITKTPASMIDPSGATNGQVLTFNGSTNTWGASSLSANGFSASLSSNGYQMFPSGIIMQWGSSIDIINSGSTRPITFPIPFPSACLSLVLGVSSPITPDNAVSAPQYTSLTNIGFSGVNKDTDSSYVMTYQAIGF